MSYGLKVAVACTLAASSTLAIGAENLTTAHNHLTPIAPPAMGISIPIGYGAQGGQMFAAIGGTTTDSPANDDLDGSAAIGIGFGNSDDFVALEVVANIISLTNNAPGSDIGEEGTFSVKLSRDIGQSSAISIGAENISTWGDATSGTNASAYVAYTKIGSLSDDQNNPLSYSLTIGLGSERFQDLDNSQRDTAPGLFAGVALAVHPQVGLVADYNGNFANVGISLIPLRSIPLGITLSAINVDEVSAADGGTTTGDTEFGGSIGYGWQF